jgi:hypothetical protein
MSQLLTSLRCRMWLASRRWPLRRNDSKDAGARDGERPGQRADAFTLLVLTDDLRSLSSCRLRWAAQRLAFALRTRQAGLSALHEQIPLHMGHGSQTYPCCLDDPLNSVLAFVYLNATIESIADCRVDNFAWRDDTLLAEPARHGALPKGLKGHCNEWN